jgi:hypothetical protein
MTKGISWGLGPDLCLNSIPNATRCSVFKVGTSYKLEEDIEGDFSEEIYKTY